jgi:hypothetical protein
MWCVNAEPKPYTAYNWFVSAYPGDNYVDIVATDIYNHPDPGVPAWKSFRYTLAETYYYLRKYYPNKPFFLCELGCRERYPGEPSTSQTKGEWLCDAASELKSYFSDTQALIFFSTVKEHDWRLNSSVNTLNAVTECFWQDQYFKSSDFLQNAENYTAFPNPFSDEISIRINPSGITANAIYCTVYDVSGRKIYSSQYGYSRTIAFGSEFSSGIYFVELKNGEQVDRIKVVKSIFK